jgi:hypothetical protein
MTVLDWIGTVIALVSTGGLFLWPFSAGPAFRQIFLEIGTDALPTLTELAVTSWFAPALGLVSLGSTFVGALAAQALPIGTRRALIVTGFIIAVAGLALCLAGAYLPIVDLAGAVRGQ